MKFDRCEDIGNGVCEPICNIDRKGLKVAKTGKVFGKGIEHTQASDSE